MLTIDKLIEKTGSCSLLVFMDFDSNCDGLSMSLGTAVFILKFDCPKLDGVQGSLLEIRCADSASDSASDTFDLLINFL